MIRHFLFILTILIIGSSADHVQAGNCTVTGKMVYMQLLAQDNTIGPFIMGALDKDTMSVTLAINVNNWEQTSKNDKDDLICYMPTLVEIVTADPDQYIDIPQSAPLYSKIRANVSTLPKNAWTIMTGATGEKGLTLLDNTVAHGR